MKCGFTRIELGREDSPQDLFIFRIGDRVQAKMSKAVGSVVGGDCYRSMGRPDQIFYQIRLTDGKTWTLRQEDIDPMLEEKAS